MDKIKVGNRLRKGDTVITITEIYLFQMRTDDDFVSVVTYDWHNVATGEMENGITTFNLNWKGWEKV